MKTQRLLIDAFLAVGALMIFEAIRRRVWLHEAHWMLVRCDPAEEWGPYGKFEDAWDAAKTAGPGWKIARQRGHRAQ